MAISSEDNCLRECFFYTFCWSNWMKPQTFIVQLILIKKEVNTDEKLAQFRHMEDLFI